MHLTATEAKNRFGHCLSQAKISPVRIEKNGRLEALIVSAEQFADLERRANAASPKLTPEQFAETYKEWIGAQQQHMDEQGLWCDDIRIW
ncbi:hypothetical protein os1_15170 [Comamonadaceae bacterium OS-1]|nr:hypothetical protein os1_15170 [Comamonadaceae bacterium OS-1]